MKKITANNKLLMLFRHQVLSLLRMIGMYPVIPLAFFLNDGAAQDTTQKIVPGRVNSAAQQQKPYVILISADGFRYDMAEKYNAVNLIRLRNQGITAAYMQPSFPSLTFPNHYTIVTGLYPAHHGLPDNAFYDQKRKSFYGMSNKTAVADSSWYGGTPPPPPPPPTLGAGRKTAAAECQFLLGGV